ncbi:MAG TPA: VWA domain-containing protein, partial [Thermoanaerobaculia bacterium]|nr:VWA domain-containing protein [Thermoanaerobaculia bacterium]
MRRSSTVWRSGVLAAGLAIAAASLAAQNFTESTEVVVVEVPVQVVRDGEPVRGLTAADFELFEGRKKLPITGFEVLDLTTAAGAQGAEPPPITARRHFLVLFDLSFSDPKAIIQARKAAHDMVAGLHPTDLVAVATYSSKGPQIALGFTPDRRQIGMAIETLGAPELVDRNLGARDPLRLVVAGAESEMASYTTLNGGQVKGGGVKESTLEAVVETMQGLQEHSDRANATAQKQKISALTRSFSDLARMMAAVEGRKYVVYLSEGFDSSLLQGTQDDTVRSDQSEAAIRGDIQDVSSETLFGDSKSLNEVESMLEEFRRADCTVQAVDIGGLRAEGEQGARRSGGKDSLLQIAKGTGGELFENTNDLGGAMQSMLKRTSVTYVLAFQPDKLKWDGSYHRLKVELKNQPRGTRVIHRPGFYAPKTFAAQNPVEKMMNAADALVSGEDSGTIKMSVLAAPFKVTGDKAYVPVVLEVDGPSLLANTTGTALPAELYIYAMDTGGAVHDFVAQTLG